MNSWSGDKAVVELSVGECVGNVAAAPRGGGRGRGGEGEGVAPFSDALSFHAQNAAYAERPCDMTRSYVHDSVIVIILVRVVYMTAYAQRQM